MSKTYLCIDSSGSTKGEWKYWQEVGNIMKKHNKNANVIFWDTEASQEPMVKALYKVLNRWDWLGSGGTDPQCFATILPEEGHLVN